MTLEQKIQLHEFQILQRNRNKELLNQLDAKILKLQEQRANLAKKIEKQEGAIAKFGNGKKSKLSKALQAAAERLNSLSEQVR